MCLVNPPKPVVVDDSDRRAQAAADAAMMARKNAFGFGATMLSPLSATGSGGGPQPSLARQVLLGTSG